MADQSYLLGRDIQEIKSQLKNLRASGRVLDGTDNRPLTQMLQEFVTGSIIQLPYQSGTQQLTAADIDSHTADVTFGPIPAGYVRLDFNWDHGGSGDHSESANFKNNNTLDATITHHVESRLLGSKSHSKILYARAITQNALITYQSLCSLLLTGQQRGGIGSHSTHLTVSNNTLRDLWIKISGDADPSVGPQQVNNGNSIGADSDDVDFGDAATFHVDVWRNNNGQQGSVIGGFDAPVRYNLAGYSDDVSLVVVTIGGTTYLQAISARAAGAAIAQLLLGD